MTHPQVRQENNVQVEPRARKDEGRTLGRTAAAAEEEEEEASLGSEEFDDFDDFLRVATSASASSGDDEGGSELGVGRKRHDVDGQEQQRVQERESEEGAPDDRPGTPPRRRPGGRRRSSLARSISGGVDAMALAPKPERKEDDFEASVAAAGVLLLKRRPLARPRATVDSAPRGLRGPFARSFSGQTTATASPKPKDEKKGDSEAESDAASPKPSVRTDLKRRPAGRGRRAAFARSFSGQLAPTASPKPKDENKKNDSEAESDAAAASPKPEARRRPARRASLTKSLTSHRASLARSFSGLAFSPGAVLGDNGATSSSDKKAFGVRFSTDEAEVRAIAFDWDRAADVFYAPDELKAMSERRFDDAARLRRRRREEEEEERRRGGSETLEDLDLSKKTTDVSALLTKALLDEDRDPSASVQGIEHFVYPDLQRAMIARKREVREEVLNFVKSKRPDPQGWRLAERSRALSQWAQDAAREKGVVYRMKLVRAEEEDGVDDVGRWARTSSREKETTPRTKEAAGVDDYEEEGDGAAAYPRDIDLPNEEEWRRIEAMPPLMPTLNLRSSSLF